MAGFDDILKSAQWHQNIQKSLGISSQLSEMFKVQDSIAKNLSGLNMASEIAKSMAAQTHSKVADLDKTKNSAYLKPKCLKIN